MAAVVACSLTAIVLLWPDAPLSFTPGGGHDIRVGQWLEANDVTRLHFVDGSVLVASASTRWRVGSTTPSGAVIQLERGRLEAAIEGGESSQWRVDAGPFSVGVTGTSFTTSWDPTSSVFELHMLRGTVVLTGPVVGMRRETHAPEHLRIDVQRQKLTLTHGARPTDDEEEEVDVPEAATDTTPAPSATVGPPVPKAVDWHALARNREHALALALIRRHDERLLLSRESAARLLLLSNAARLGGDAGLALRALEALERRFPHTKEAAQARFLTGKLHYDLGRMDQAIAELSSYLQSTPSGGVAAEAMVLKILALKRSGRVVEARAQMRIFVERWPSDGRVAHLRAIIGSDDRPP